MVAFGLAYRFSNLGYAFTFSASLSYNNKRKNEWRESKSSIKAVPGQATRNKNLRKQKMKRNI